MLHGRQKDSHDHPDENHVEDHLDGDHDACTLRDVATTSPSPTVVKTVTAKYTASVRVRTRCSIVDFAWPLAPSDGAEADPHDRVGEARSGRSVHH